VPRPSGTTRVAYFLHRFPYLTETFILREMDWVRRSGIDVHIFSLLKPHGTLVHDRVQGLLPQTHYSPLVNKDVLAAQLYFLRRNPMGYARALVRLMWQTYREPRVLLGAVALFPKSVLFARRLEELAIDHIHAHFVWLEALAAGVAKDLLGITFTIHPHAFGLFSRNQTDVVRTLENASAVVTVSEFHRAHIAGLSPGLSTAEIDVVHYGIETGHFVPAEASPPEPPRILSVGRAVEKKGHEHLITACSLLAQRGYEFECDIVAGSGGNRDRLEKQITDLRLGSRVRLLDNFDENTIVPIYQRSHIFALACVVATDGDRDGLPNVIIEAMSCGLPVVTTPVTGIPELVKDNVTGLLIAERDPGGLADAIERLMIDRALRDRLGESARHAVESGFQIEQTSAQLASVFERFRRS
jgi:glycosyltransferase involved in cell wall biosynthesis